MKAHDLTQNDIRSLVRRISGVAIVAEELEKPAELHEKGVLTEADFEAGKRRLLG